MQTPLEAFFNSSYMPHGHCYLWQPGILWVNVLSDLLIATAYFSIPIALWIFVKQRKDLRFKGIFILFALFILCCGITHLFSIYTIWHGSYGVHGILKAITAIISITTALILFKNINTLLAIPSAQQLEEAINRAATEKSRRAHAEQTQKSEAIFKFALELLPTGLLIIDTNQTIRVVNNALAKLFEYEPDELVGMPLAALLNDEQAKFHHVLTQSYLNQPEQAHAMASGRTVRGKTKYGNEVWVEVSLSTHDFNNEKHVFASVNNTYETISDLNFVFEKSNRLQRVIDATEDGIWEWNIQSNDVWYSNRLMHMLGVNPDTTKADFNLWREHIHPDDKDRVLEALEQHVTQQQKYDVTYRGQVSPEQYQWVRARGNTIFDTDNQPLLMSGTLTNVNYLKELEIEISEKSRFLNAILNKSLSGMFIYDLPLQRITFVNKQFCEITGYNFKQLEIIQSQKSFIELIHPDDQVMLQTQFNDLFTNQNSEANSLEFRIQHQNGHWVWCFCKQSVYSFNDLHLVKEIIGTFFDISDQKEQKDKIRSLSQDFYTTFEQAAVGIAHVGLDGSWLKANKKICEILEYNLVELLSLNFQKITHPDDLDEDLELVATLMSGEQTQYSIEKRYICKSGRVIWAYLTVSLVIDEWDNPSHFISVIEDITERKEVESALAESNLALEKFAYSASHDLQEPLRKISAFSDSLSDRLVGKLSDPDAVYELSRITDAASRMRGMINSLLQLSRYSKHQLHKEQLQFSGLVELLKEDLSQAIKESQCTILLEQDFIIDADLNSFLQVLRNLVTNSIRYRDESRALVVTFSSQTINDKLMLTIN
ncbi:hypothetical protein PULV_a1085 [Pseudoalteromonas ulvae UL12]|uniref:PAS domain-containing protein n=1 Tax=Pseudoalteromonas ulvae TaxID=107327 RepID=UPI00186B99A6|nr:PAS domain-containing protein [Pseudoalteromonas ulvae]MBE0363616.1 hypothetical protein [Pseudoalteromonas ulvae UL12]